MARHELELPEVPERPDGLAGEAGPRATHAVDELRRDGLLDVRDLDGAAGLSDVAERPARDPGDRARHVAVGEDDGRVLPAHLDARGDPALGAPYADHVTGPGRAGEHARVDAGVDQRGADRPLALNGLYEPVGELVGQARDEPRARSRGVLRGLEDHAVARHERRKDRPVQPRDRVVPRRDDPDHAARDPVDVRAFVREAERVQANVAPRGGRPDDAGPAAHVVERAQGFVEEPLDGHLSELLAREVDRLGPAAEHLLGGALQRGDA